MSQFFPLPRQNCIVNIDAVTVIKIDPVTKAVTLVLPEQRKYTLDDNEWTELQLRIGVSNAANPR